MTGWLLLLALAAVVVLQLAGTVRTVASAEAGPDKGIKIFLFCIVATFVAGYIAFAVSGANLSAMDFRYSAAAVSVLSIFLGLWYDRLSVLSRDKTCSVIMFSSVAFAALSCVFYILAGLFAAT